MSNNDDLQSTLRAGVDAARRGDRATARRLLEQVINVDENNEMAWLWLASVVTTTAERRACLERVLAINPNNERAREALRRLNAERGGTGQTSAASPPPRPPRQRRAAAPQASPDDTGDGGGINTSFLIGIGLIVAIAVIVAVVLSIVNNQQAAPVPTTVVAAVNATDTPGPTDTPAATNTPVPIEEITRSAPTLPPTFTPTSLPTATDTPEPTEEPTPLIDIEMLYTSLNTGAVEPDVYTIRADGSNEGGYIDFAKHIALSWDGEQIAFVRDVADDNGDIFPEIFTASANDVENATQITSLSNSNTGYPSWSPDASQIVFSSGFESDSEEIWIIDANGDNPRRLTENTFIDRDPAWSPTNPNYIVFVSDRDSLTLVEIYSMMLPESPNDAPQIERMTDFPNSSYSPSWSQDGERIVFISDRNGNGDIFTMRADGQAVRIVFVDDTGAEDREPALSPDQRWIAFISNREDNTFQLYLSSIDGQVLNRLTNNGRQDLSVVFRPAQLDPR